MKSKILNIIIILTILFTYLNYFTLSQTNNISDDEDFPDKPELWKQTNDWSKLTPEKLLQGENQIDNVNENQVNSYFSSNYPSYPPLNMNGLNSAELKLAQTLSSATLDQSLTSINNLKIDKQGNLITPNMDKINLENAQLGTNIEYTNEGIKITNNEGKSIIVSYGSVNLNSDNTFEINKHTKIKTNQNDIIETTTNNIKLYLDKTENSCKNCIVLDSINNHVRLDADGLNLQLGENRKDLTLDIGNTQGTNYILDKDGKKTYKIHDGKISIMVNEGDASNTGFLTDLTNTRIVPGDNILGLTTLNSCTTNIPQATGLHIKQITGRSIEKYCDGKRTGVVYKYFFKITGTYLQNVNFEDSNNPSEVLNSIDTNKEKFEKIKHAKEAEIAISKIYKKEIPDDKINDLIKESKESTKKAYNTDNLVYSGSSMQDYEEMVTKALKSDQGTEIIFGFNTDTDNSKKGYIKLLTDNKIEEKEVDYKLIEQIVFYNSLVSNEKQGEILLANIN
jgi:hypothetical protein